MTVQSRTTTVPLVDWAKAIASHLIVWHHLVWYGPMAVAAAVLAPDLIDWLRDSARMAVQVFLVVGGFLAARGLVPTPWHAARPRPADLPGLIVKRYWRLAKPYWLALCMAMVGAAIARTLIVDADTPGVATWPQVLANATFLQDVLDLPALSAGVWYVAIDLQLFITLALLASLGRVGRPGTLLNRCARLASVLGTVALTLASLLWFNLHESLDAWAPYFFGAYGLGVLAHWTVRQERRGGLQWALAALVLLALWVEWRSRIAVAGAMTLLLAGNWFGRTLATNILQPVVNWMARVSYALFLVHYPVVLVVGSMVHHRWPGQPWPNAIGLLLAWCGSMLAASWLHSLVEARRPSAPALPLAHERWVGQQS